MSGLLDLYAAQAGPSAPPLVSIPSTAGERFDAEYEAATAPDRWSSVNGARRNWYQRVIDEHHAETGKTLLNPYGAVTPEEMLRLGNQPAVIEERKNKLIEENRALREIKPDALNAENVDQAIGLAGEAARGRAADLVGTGNGLAGFAGGMLAPTPENILGAFIPPSRAIFGATAVARSFLGGLGREAAYQAGAMGALTAATEGMDVLARQETGTAPGAGEVVSNIVGGALGGAVLGGAFHALHMGPRALWERWNRLPEDVRANAPLEVRDSMKVLGQDALYGDSNRLGLPQDLHERYQGRANDAVLRGTPPNFEDLAGVGEMPMTGLATVLREVPTDMRVRGMDILDRLSMTPGALEDVAREARPDLFSAVNQRTSDELIKEERARLYDAAGAVPRRRKDMNDQAAFNVFSRETASFLDQRLGEFSLTRDEAHDLFTHYKRGKGQTPEQALEDAIDRWGDATERSALRSPELDEEWRKDMEALGAHFENERHKGGGSYSDFRGRETRFPELTNYWTMERQPVDEEIPFGQGSETARNRSGDGAGGGQEPAARGATSARRQGAETGGARGTEEAAAEAVRRDIAAALEKGKANPELAAAIQRAEFNRHIRTVRTVAPVERAAPESAPITPEMQTLLDAETQRVLASKDDLGGFKKILLGELDAADHAEKDVKAAMRCLNAGVPL